MGVSYFIGVLLAAASTRVRAPNVLLARVSRRTLLWIAACVTVGLVFTLVAELRIIDIIALPQGMPAWRKALPLAVLLDAPPFTSLKATTFGTTVQVLTFVQSGLLAILWAVLRRAETDAIPYRRFYPILALGALAMATAAFLAKAGGPDIYAYVEFALVPNPYHPAAFAASHVDPAIARVWAHRIVPSPYGPGWTLLSRAAVALAHDLASQVYVFRAIGCLAMVASIGALLAARRTIAAALFGLNPTLWHVYLTEAHNDVVGIALVLLAYAARRFTPAAIVLVALAGAIKLPFLAIGVVVFASAPSLRARVVPATIATLCGLALSLVFGGSDYIWAMHRTTELYAHEVNRYEWVSHALLGAIGLGALATVVLVRRCFWGASWSFMAFGQYTAWQYLGWAVPYAILDETRGALYLALLPVTGYEVTLFFGNTALFNASRVALICLPLAALVLSFRRNVHASPPVLRPRVG
jgi:hypothetical protein